MKREAANKQRCTVQPLPEAYLVAAELRRQAKELVLAAERLEASCDVPPCDIPLEFVFGNKNKPTVKRKLIKSAKSTKGSKI